MALLLVLVGMNCDSGGDSGWLSENCSGRWLVTWAVAEATGSEEKDSIWVPNRPWVRYTGESQNRLDDLKS